MLAPLLRDSNQIWLGQQLWSAVPFGLGAGLAVLAAALSYWNYMSHAIARLARADARDLWIRGIEFQIDREWQRMSTVSLDEIRTNALRRAQFTYLTGIILAILSSGAWLVGALLLVRSIMTNVQAAG